MSALQQDSYKDERIVCPLIILSERGSKVLTARGPERLCLPSVSVPARVRLAASLTSAVEQSLGLRTVHSLSIPSSSDRSAYRVMECTSGDDLFSAAYEWKPASELTSGSFADTADFQAVLAAIRRTALVGSSEPFSTLDWFPEVREWVGESVTKCGLRLTGEFRQWNAAPGFSLIRFATDQGAVWFKAVKKEFTDELEITRTLCALFPDDTVPVIALNPKWNAWLAIEGEGCCLDEVDCPDAWQYVSGRLADLQIASIEHTQEILDSGATNLGKPDIFRRIQSLIECAGTLMAQQRKPVPSPLTDGQLQKLQHAIERSLSEANDIAPPDALGNIDFNPGNVIVNRAGSCRFIDWAGAYIGYPFATFEYLRQRFRRLPNKNRALEERLQEAYWMRWRKFLSEAQIARLRCITPLLAVFFFAEAVHRQRGHVSDAASAGYMRSLVRRMKLEADLIAAPHATASQPA